jgi:hypothetical protein
MRDAGEAVIDEAIQEALDEGRTPTNADIQQEARSFSSRPSTKACVSGASSFQAIAQTMRWPSSDHALAAFIQARRMSTAAIVCFIPPSLPTCQETPEAQ